MSTKHLDPPQSGHGGSRAAQRRAKKKAKMQHDDSTCADVGSATNHQMVGHSPSAEAIGRSVAAEGATPASSSAPSAGTSVHVDEESNSVGAGNRRYREWQIPMPDPGSELHDALQVALSQASTIHGRKYRYGAILLSGEDFIPLRSGSNKTIFQRDKIHAEMSALKGFDRPAGKDMLIGRLAPVRPPATRLPGAGDETSEDSDADRSAPAASANDEHAPSRGAIEGKVLNARPCDRCEARMVAKGIRRCYFTVNRTSMGVLEYNPEVTRAHGLPRGGCPSRRSDAEA